MSDKSLHLLATDVRGKTLKLLEGVGDETARFAPPGLNNSLLWHAGHALVVVEHLAVMPATGQPASYPAGWFEMFSWKSTPASVKTWPALSDVVRRLQVQLQRLVPVIEGLREDQLESIPVVNPPRNRTLRHSILHGFHDEANHQGEMWLLKKMYSAKTS
jgi:DinB family protein